MTEAETLRLESRHSPLGLVTPFQGHPLRPPSRPLSKGNLTIRQAAAPAGPATPSQAVLYPGQLFPSLTQAVCGHSSPQAIVEALSH